MKKESKLYRLSDFDYGSEYFVVATSREEAILYFKNHDDPEDQHRDFTKEKIDYLLKRVDDNLHEYHQGVVAHAERA